MSFEVGVLLLKHWFYLTLVGSVIILAILAIKWLWRRLAAPLWTIHKHL